MEVDLQLPGGEVLSGGGPVVIIGPNGSGKTRLARQIVAGSGAQTEFVNALRNTRVAPELPAMGQDTARSQFNAQRQQSKQNHWELSSEFDSMLAQLLGQTWNSAMDFQRRFRDDPATAGTPEETALTRVEDLWRKVFPGRQLRWDDWKPTIDSVTSGARVTYSGNQMSDGEKAALYLAGRVFTTEAGVVLVVDEPETHFHSLLAVRLWNEFEKARPDLRFVYITHDLTFALSRTNCTYVLASPTGGLRSVALGDGVPDDVAGALLGSASLSFYASRVVFCEGGDDSLDSRLFSAWFDGADTIVRPVDSCHRVLRCVEALNSAGLALSLTAIGIVDRDFYPETFLQNLSSYVAVLPVHEVESLFALPDVLHAVATHLDRNFVEEDYLAALRSSIPEQQRRQIIIQRWKAAVEPYLTGLVADTSKRNTTVQQLITDMPNIFNYGNWSFSPETILQKEDERVTKALDDGSDAMALLSVVPGKPLLPLASNYVGLQLSAYVDLVINTLRSSKPDLAKLRDELVKALQAHLPPRHVATVGSDSASLTPE